MRVAVLTMHAIARDMQVVESHGGPSDAGDLVKVMDHLTHRSLHRS